MTTTTAVATLDDSGLPLGAARHAIASAVTATEAFEVASRVKMAKAWAQAHGKLRDLRLQLLELEVAALVQVVRLGGEDLLTPQEHKAGQWFAAMSDDERATTIKESRNVTTATGLSWSVRQKQERHRGSAERKEFGAQWASVTPGERQREELRKAMAHQLDNYSYLGEPFEVAEMAEDLVAVTIGPDDEWMEGVKHMCRNALRRGASLDMIEGVKVPKFITSQLPDDTWIRIPAAAATYGDLLVSLDAREEQMRQDAAALNRFKEFVGVVARHVSTNDTTVGEVLAQMSDSSND